MTHRSCSFLAPARSPWFHGVFAMLSSDINVFGCSSPSTRLRTSSFRNAAAPRTALESGTSSLKLAAGEVVDFPTKTSDALMSGGANAIAGGIERQARRLEARTEQTPLLLMTGGAACQAGADHGPAVRDLGDTDLRGADTTGGKTAAGLRPRYAWAACARPACRSAAYALGCAAMRRCNSANASSTPAIPRGISTSLSQARMSETWRRKSCTMISSLRSLLPIE